MQETERSSVSECFDIDLTWRAASLGGLLSVLHQSVMNRKYVCEQNHVNMPSFDYNCYAYLGAYKLALHHYVKYSSSDINIP